MHVVVKKDCDEEEEDSHREKLDVGMTVFFVMLLTKVALCV